MSLILPLKLSITEFKRVFSSLRDRFLKMSPSMNGHMNGEVQEISDLMQSGINGAKSHAQEPKIHDLDVSKLRITHTTTPRKVPELDSAEVWGVKACTLSLPLKLV